MSQPVNADLGIDDDDVVEFFVPGRPAPQGSKRHVGHGIMVESSRDLGPWRERVALAANPADLRRAVPFLKILGRSAQ